jgi:amino acid adenylation domain-containing protein
MSAPKTKVQVFHRELKEERDYWLARLARAEAPACPKPDFARAARGAAPKESVAVVFPERVAQGVAKLTNGSPFLLYVTLMTALKVCMHKYAGGSRGPLVVGSPARRRGEENPVNALAILDEVDAGLGVRELLKGVRETLVQAYARQRYPFERLARDLGPDKSRGGRALFDIALVLRDIHGSLPELDNALTLTFETTPEGVSGRVEFDGGLFMRETVERFARHFVRALDGVASNADARVGDIDILTDEERRQILRLWNDTRTERRAGECVHEWFEARARLAPDATALVMGGERVGYGELNARANRMARHLRALGVGPEVRVGVCAERSVEMVVALLGVLKAGGAYLPLDPAHPQQRLDFMLGDSGVRVLLTQQKPAARFGQGVPHVFLLDSQWGEIADADGRDLPPVATGRNLAYVIYTSGSTGIPKGVLVEHSGLCNLVEAQTQAFDIRPESRVLQFASFGFDASVSEIFTALTAGATLCLSPQETLSAPPSLARVLSEQAVSVVTLPPAMLAVLKTEGLSCVRTLVAAGESCSVEVAARWSEGRRFINAYGPTETTVCATMHQYDDQRSEVVPIGRPMANAQVYILDPALRPVPAGVAGELYVGGRGVARGYLGRPALTAERFIPDPFSGEEGSRLYRTGDLCRYAADGLIEFIGRTDNQVKIRGFRIELGEIEAALRGHEGVDDAAVVVRDGAGGDRRLVAYVCGRGGAAPSADELREHLRGRLPEYMVPSQYVMLEALPLTANGKVDRRALPEPGTEAGVGCEEYVAPRTAAEEAIASIWAEVLGVERVSAHDNFFDLGGHSLLATQVVSRAEEALGVELTLDKLFDSPTVAGLAAAAEQAAQSAGGSRGPAIKRAERSGELPLSFAQQRLWFIDQFEPGSPFYNVSAAMRLKGMLDVAALAQTLNEVVRRHDSLRTTFSTVDGQPVQVIAPALELKLDEHDLRHVPAPERDAEARRLAVEEAKRPFDLARGPLLRVKLLRLGPEEHVASLTMHHIVSDGWSMGVLIREVAACYEAAVTGKPALLPELPIQYADFAAWQRERLSGEGLEELLAYWRRQLASLPELNLPTDHPRPAVQTVRGAYQVAALPPALSAQLRALGQQEGATVFMVLLAAFQTLLYRYTGRHDIVVGTDVANRNRVETEGLIGVFVNHLVMRTDLSGGPTFRELLSRVREASLGAYAHQDMPFDMLVKALKPKRDLSHTPLFQVLFVVQNAPMPELNLTGLTLSPVEADNETTKFDLALFVTEAEDGLVGTWKYNADLFEAATITRMAKNFETLIGGIAANPDAPLDELVAKVNGTEKERLATTRAERQEAKLKKLATVRRKAIDVQDEVLVEMRELDGAGPLPLLLRPASPDLDPLSWAAANRERLSGLLARHGGLLLRGFGVASPSDFERLAAALCPPLYADYGDLPRERAGGRVYSSTPYPNDRAILFHNESSHLERWPMRILFYCSLAPRSGGQTPIADCRRVFGLLSPEVRERFRREGLIYARHYAPGLDVAWEDFFHTSDRREVERRLSEAGATWEWTQGGGLCVRQRARAVARHPQTGEEVFFNQVQLHHSSSLGAEVRSSLAEVFGEDGLPRQVYWGGGEAISDEVMEEVGRAYEGAAVDFAWEEGDVLMLDNMLVAHGRRPFEGERKVVVAMGQMMEAAGVA